MLTSPHQGQLILGIDPGTTTTGYGFIRLIGEKEFEVVDYGLIETERNEYAPARYTKIYHDFVDKLIVKHRPNVMAIEKIFFASNARTAISVGQAQGVMFLAAHKCGLSVVEYAPPTIKKVVTGDGRAKKKDVEAKVREILGSESNKVKLDKERRITKTHIDNAVDAIAVALCHAFHLYDNTLKNHEKAVDMHARKVTVINGVL